MPTRYVIDKERRLVVSSAWDRVSYQEMVTHRNRLRDDPAFNPAYDQLVDGRAVTGLDVSLEQAKEFASTSLFSSHSRRAFVASNLEVLGIARLAEAYSGAPRGREEVRVFYELSAALEWLGLQLDGKHTSLDGI
jgi:hypothetical protein